jgi:hypothetical protein
VKRTIAVVTVALLMSGAVIETVTAARVSLKPNPVRQDRKVQARWRHCKSGPDYKAFVWIVILDQDETNMYERYIPADDDGVTKKKILIKRTRFRVGDYDVRLACFHEPDDGERWIRYILDRTLTVKQKK